MMCVSPLPEVQPGVVQADVGAVVLTVFKVFLSLDVIAFFALLNRKDSIR